MKKGFTIIEMVVVLACITALSAIITPNLLASMESVKLKSDIQSAMIIQSALELYIMEKGEKPTATTGAQLISELKATDYIKDMGATPQLNRAVWGYNKTEGRVLLDLSSCSAGVKNMAKSIDAQYLIYVSGTS